MSRRIVSLLVGAVGLAAAGLAGAQQPPRELHWAGDHWTAWYPPAAAPVEAEVHVIEHGDTLWDLAAGFYGDPYFWPQLWEQNRYIEDAHWIYPGDPLAVRPAVMPVERLAENGGITADRRPPEAGRVAPRRRELPFARFQGEPVALGSESDIACSGYIGALDERFDSRVIGSEHQSLAPTLAGGVAGRGFYGRARTVKAALTRGDIVYVDGGVDDGMRPGRMFRIVEPADTVRHPDTGEVVGRHYRYNGTLRVLAAQEGSAIAEIVQACDPIAVGARLASFEQEPVPLGRRPPMHPVNDPPAAAELADAPVVLYSDARLVSLGTGHLVYIDRGAADEVAPGDLFTVYRRNVVPELPPVVLGEVAVLSVRPHASLARILESRYAVHLGDVLVSRP